MSQDPPPMSDDKTGKVYEAHLSRDDSVGAIYFISPFPIRLDYGAQNTVPTYAK